MSEQPPFTPDAAALLNAASAPRLVLLEIWKPLRYLGHGGPRVFWRERIPKAYDVTQLEPPPPWRVMAPEFYVKVRALPNNHFTDDKYPGVTFTWRKMRGPTLGDHAQVQALRAAA